MRNVYVAVLGTAMLVFAGCGDDDKKSDSSSGEKLTKSEYIAKADDICRDTKKATKKYSDQLDELQGKAGNDLTKLAPILEGGFKEERKGRARLRALPAPSEDKATLDAYFASADKTLDVGAQLERAAKENDVAKAKKLIKDNEGVDDRQKQQATQYGFKVCGLS
jgi:hypothetical protein